MRIRVIEMSISDKSARKLQAILQKERNQNISLQEAKQIGSWLVRFYKHLAISEPINNKNNDKQIN